MKNRRGLVRTNNIKSLGSGDGNLRVCCSRTGLGFCCPRDGWGRALDRGGGIQSGWSMRLDNTFGPVFAAGALLRRFDGLRFKVGF